MPNKTEHFQLNQWEPEDKFLREDFNADNAALETALTDLQTAINDVPQPVIGSYSGGYAPNNSTATAINLGFSPRLVFVFPYTGRAADSNASYGAMAYPGCNNKSGISITNTGFSAANTSSNYVNSTGMVYHYVALP